MKRYNSPTDIPADDPDEINRAMIEQINEATLCFESTLTLEEIEANFKNVNVGDQIIEALNELLQNTQKQKGSK